MAKARITKLREAVKAALDPALGIKLQPGKLDGPVDGRVMTGCIWSEGTQQNPEQADEQLLVVTVRLFNVNKRRRSRRTPVDVGSELEELGELIQTTWRAHVQDETAGVWFSWVQMVEFDPPSAMLEAQIVASSDNPAQIPG